MNKHPYTSPEAVLLLLAECDLLTISGEGGGNGGGGNGDEGGDNPPFWQGGTVVFPDIPIG